jgi:4-amino-4-deoxy-L-arabinose transferase-like glycosyltransferase
MFLTPWIKKNMANWLRINFFLQLKSNRIFAVLLLLCIWALLYLPGLGSLEVHGNEARRILPAVTMLDNGDWVSPMLAGRKYFKKPPMINWMVATSFFVFGECSEFAARFPSALLVLLFTMLLAFMPSKWLDKDTRFMAALMFLATYGIIDSGRECEIDGPLACVTAMACLWWLNIRSLKAGKWLLWFAPAFLLGFGILLKGPLILLFFYPLVLAVLYFDGRKFKELLSIQHILGILLMLVIFGGWAYLNSKQATHTGKVTSTWSTELLQQINPTKINFGKWFRNVLNALLIFLPWLVFVPLLWSAKFKEYLRKAPESALVKGLGWGIIIGFILMNIQPGTRIRYSIPLLPLGAIFTANLISCQGVIGEKILAIWRKILLGVAYLLAILLIIATILIPSGLFLKLLSRFKVEPIMSLEVSWWIVVLAVLAGIWVIIRTIKFYRDFDAVPRLVLNSVLLITCLALCFSAYVIPVMNLFADKRVMGEFVAQNVPENKTLNLYSFEYETFLYYFRPPLKYLFTTSEFNGNTEYVILNEKIYDCLLEDKELQAFKPQILASRKYKKQNYHILKLTPPTDSQK